MTGPPTHQTGHLGVRCRQKLNIVPVHKKTPGAWQLRGSSHRLNSNPVKDLEDPMALSLVGNTDDTPDRPVTVPTPPSICPLCGNVEADSRHYQRGPIDEALYVCWAGHSWLARWVEPQAVA